MEGRDPSAAPSAAGKEGSLEEDRLLSVTAVLAKDAAFLFQSRRYAECVDVLRQLLLKKEDDPKVLHNIAVAEYFRDGCPDPRKLLDVLGKVKRRSEDLARASREQSEAANGIGSNVISGSRGSTTVLHQFSSANNSIIAYADEFDTSIVTFNSAVIFYHLHDYAHAISVLEPLYQNIEPIDETTALHVCLLLLDIALACQDATKAADILQRLERCFGVGSILNHNDNGSIGQQLSSNQLKVTTKSNTAPDASGSDSNASANENPLVGNLSDDALEYETLYSTLDSGNQNLGRPALNDLSKASADVAASAADLKLKLQLYKVRLLLLIRNLKVAKRELKLAMNMARGRDSSAELLLKSQLEYARGNHRKAVKLLSTPGNRTEKAMVTMFYNNLGCIHHQLRSHQTSGWFFTKALRHSSSFRLEKPLKLATYSQDKSRLISYNCGLQHLICGRPFIAARCFREAIPLLYNRPLFWLRFAECCLLALEEGLLSSATASSFKGEITIHVVGSGKWRQVVVNSVNLRSSYSDSRGGDGMISDENLGLLSLSFARQCLLNAQLLLDTPEQKTAKPSSMTAASDSDTYSEATSINIKSSNQKNTSTDLKGSNSSASTLATANGESKGGASSNNTLQCSVASYESICGKDNHKIKQAVLADLAYIELCLMNPLRALHAAKAFQQLPGCSRIYIFLSHVYAAEALCHLNRPTEAAEQLSIYILDGNNVELPYSNEDRENWFIEEGGDGEDLNCSATLKPTFEEPQHLRSLKPEEARGVLFANLAVMFAVQGDLEQASYFAKQSLASLPNDPRSVLAAVYVDLRQGKTQEALPKLRQCRRVSFLASNPTVSS
ncbi:uncharacterized protein [Typha latifolia]|uniref:uncharacterized protein n=1 Tax=Typha latifolia TaxID=4733 RepID=UPI003C2E0BCB